MPSKQAIPAELTVAQLEKHLWSAADILRGSIDSSDYKTYIFGLLFLKRLSDRFEEEAERLILLGDAPDDVAWTDPDYHEFFVPDRARWSAIERTATNIGECLNKACMALEEQNAGLEGVLAGIDWNDEHRLGDGRQRDSGYPPNLSPIRASHSSKLCGRSVSITRKPWSTASKNAGE